MEGGRCCLLAFPHQPARPLAGQRGKGYFRRHADGQKVDNGLRDADHDLLVAFGVDLEDSLAAAHIDEGFDLPNADAAVEGRIKHGLA